ncbi:MAG: Rrf2 family transcriptional regulator [Gammaproteobacteria bacterium]|nr:Rrf2 family transcriptional regulator [Gammaproteobacteria bacterium]NIR58767.1 Rrf2 family transcriptional regulator [Gammaproteobacteria bacterium]NIV73799.1 Rrf2 family transcriptional regulator [Gammaproteobacteria bacterium]
MKIGSSGRYGVLALLELAVRDTDDPVPLADIAGALGVSVSYLEQIFVRLRRSGLVVGLRGPGGGYRLAREPDRLTVGEIIAAAEGPPQAASVAKGSRMPRTHLLAAGLWEELSREISRFLHGITLAQFSARPSVQARARAARSRSDGRGPEVLSFRK